MNPKKTKPKAKQTPPERVSAPDINTPGSSNGARLFLFGYSPCREGLMSLRGRCDDLCVEALRKYHEVGYFAA
jgi:hypothetical protein